MKPTQHGPDLPEEELSEEGDAAIEALLSPSGIGASRRAQMIEAALDRMASGAPSGDGGAPTGSRSDAEPISHAPTRAATRDLSTREPTRPASDNVRPLRRRVTFGTLSGLAVAAVLAVAILPREPSVRSKGGGETGAHAELLCRGPNGSDRCQPGVSILLSVEPPVEAPFVRVTLKNPDGSVEARFPAAGAPALDGRVRAQGVLPKKFVLGPSDPLGRYEVDISFHARPNDPKPVHTITRDLMVRSPTP